MSPPNWSGVAAVLTRHSSSPLSTSWAVMKQPPGRGLDGLQREPLMTLPFTMVGPAVCATRSR